MAYQKIINLLDNKPNQPSKLRTQNWIETNDDSYNTDSQIKFKTMMLNLSLCDHSDAYILVKGTITVPNTAFAPEEANNTNRIC